MSEARLRALVERSGQPRKSLVRDKEPLFIELGLADAGEAELFAVVAAHPVLLNRPIVVTERLSGSVGPRARLCRPGDRAAELL